MMTMTEALPMRRKGKSRPIIGSAILCVYLCAQFVALMHAAEYGAGHHDHNGHPCTIQLLCETGKGSSLVSALPLATPEIDHSPVYPPVSGRDHFVSPNAFSIRAPPGSFLT